MHNLISKTFPNKNPPSKLGRKQTAEKDIFQQVYQNLKSIVVVPHFVAFRADKDDGDD